MIQFYMEEKEDPNSTALIAALSTLPPPTLSSLTTSLSSAFRHHRHRVSAILSSPPLFSDTLRRLFSLSLPQKSLLIAKYLLSTLQPVAASLAPPPPSTARIRLRDLDAVLVLLLFCEVRQHDPMALETTSSRDWHRVLAAYYCDNVLSLSGLKVSPNEAVRSLIDVVAKCRRFVGSAISGCEASSGREVAASVAAVVALPSVEVTASWEAAAAECAICKEEMSEGRDVCELPCQHLFHWMCVLRWLRERNTCPCCRHRLPTDDVYGEIERLWEVVVRAARPHLHVDVCI